MTARIISLGRKTNDAVAFLDRLIANRDFFRAQPEVIGKYLKTTLETQRKDMAVLAELDRQK